MSYELIETVEVGAGGASSIEFTSIPQDGVDLVLLYSSQRSDANNQRLQFNGDTGSNYSEVYLFGNGSSAASSSNSSISNINTWTGNALWTGNAFGNVSVYISNYTSSTSKSVSVDSVSEANATLAYQYLNAGVYSTTSPITSVKLTLDSTEFSSFSLYKIS